MANALKKSILILTPFYRPNIGGVESYLSDLSEYLKAHGFAVYVLTYQPLTTRVKAPAYEARDNLKIRRINWPGYNLFHRLEPYPLLEFIYLTPCLFVYTFFLLLAGQKDFDVIHAQGLNAAFITRILAKVFHKRAVMSTCAVYNLKIGYLFSRIVRWTLSGMDKILALGEYSKKELLSIGVPAAKVEAYGLWVDQSQYVSKDKQAAREKVGLKAKFIVLFVGRFIKIKGIEALIEAARRLEKAINFVFVGDQGPLLNYLEKEAVRQDNVILIKGISGLELVPYYQAADLLVVPSLYDEAFGKVIIEALSCGTPVIGSSRGAIPNIINNSVGRIIEPKAESIAREIDYMYRNPEVLAKITANCRVYAEDNFGEKNIEVITKSYYA